MKAVLLLLLLVGCGAQSTPEMWGAERRDITRNGRSYTVFQKGKQVEIIRLGWASPGEHEAIRATMIELVQEVTGCTLVPGTLKGDSGEMRGRVNCPKPG